MPRPAFVSLDGLDGTGKSTQARMLAEWLGAQKVPVTSCTDPGGTALGAELRRILLFGREHRIATTTEAMLFMASRAQLVEEVIRPALERGEVVISDRFLLANVVYQGHAGGLSADDLWTVGMFATGNVEPALTFVLDAPIELLRGRGVAEPTTEILERAKTGFLYEAGRRPQTHRIVDAALPANVVHAHIRAEVQRLLLSQGWELSTS